MVSLGRKLLPLLLLRNIKWAKLKNETRNKRVFNVGRSDSNIWSQMASFKQSSQIKAYWQNILMVAPGNNLTPSVGVSGWILTLLSALRLTPGSTLTCFPLPEPSSLRTTQTHTHKHVLKLLETIQTNIRARQKYTHKHTHTASMREVAR